MRAFVAWVYVLVSDFVLVSIPLNPATSLRLEPSRVMQTEHPLFFALPPQASHQLA